MLPFHKVNARALAQLAIPALLIAQSGVAVALIEGAPSVTVRYHDLNLNSLEGAANLYERIHTAAVVVCKSAEGPQLVNRVFWSEWNECINHAVANAVNTVHSEKLSAIHWERIRGWKRRFATPMSVTGR